MAALNRKHEQNVCQKHGYTKDESGAKCSTPNDSPPAYLCNNTRCIKGGMGQHKKITNPTTCYGPCLQ